MYRYLEILDFSLPELLNFLVTHYQQLAIVGTHLLLCCQHYRS